MKQKPTLRPCGPFGGRNPKSGKRVGSRHRWDGGAWGKGYCVYCGRTLDMVIDRDKEEKK